VRRVLHLDADVYRYNSVDYLLNHRRKERENYQVLMEAINDFQPDLVFFWGMWNLSPALMAAAQSALPGRVANSFAGYWPLIPDIHEDYWLSSRGSAISSLFRRLLSPLTLSRIYRKVQWRDISFDHAVFCSQFMADHFAAHGFECPHIQVILSGIDVDAFRPSGEGIVPQKGGQLRVLFCGGYVQHKGGHIVIDAIRLLRDRGVQAHLTIVGKGSDSVRDQYHQQVVRDHLEGVVSLQGSIARSEMPSLMRGHDVVVLATLSDDPLPRVVMEAMSCGLVAIASNRAGPPEMITHNVDGLLFTPEDSQELAGLLHKVAHKPEWARNLATEARVTAERRFTLSRMNDEMENFLKAAVRC
jgi:glycosyltransferase involved in cell wall biosynthesis